MSVSVQNTEPSANSATKDCGANCGSRLVKKTAIFGLPRLLRRPLHERRGSQPLLQRGRWLPRPSERRTQGGEAEVEQVRSAGNPDRQERWLLRAQQRHEPGAGGECPDQLPEGDAGGGVNPAASPSRERVADRQCRVLSWRDDHERRDGEKRRRVREHLGALGERRRAARAAALLEVLLVVVLGDVERLRGLDHGHDRLAVAAGSVELGLRALGGGALALVLVEDDGAVLVADVPALPVQLRRVVLAPEGVEQLLVRHA